MAKREDPLKDSWAYQEIYQKECDEFILLNCSANVG